MKNNNPFWRQVALSGLGAARRLASSPLTAALIAAPLALTVSCGHAQAQTSPPTTLSRTVAAGSTSLTVNFKLHSVRSANFEVDVQALDGSLVSASVDVPRTYLGTVVGRPGAIAAGWFQPDGKLWCKIIFENGTGVETKESGLSSFGSANPVPAYPTTAVAAGGAGSSVYGAEMGMDVANDYYVASGSDVAKTVAVIEWVTMKTDAIYLRDAAIVMKLGRIVIRQTSSKDPYAGLKGGSGEMLGQVKDQWNTVLPASTDDLVSVISISGGGGLAYVGVVGGSYRYSTSAASSSGDYEAVWRHEVGHNWGSNHYEGGSKPEGPTIMSDNSLSRFSGPELAKIIAHRNNVVAKLDNLGSYSYPLPPRANTDRVTLQAGAPVTLDVLANDSDSNGQTLTIQSFDATSPRGGKIALLVGTGPGGRNQLIYTPPASATALDIFNYRIQDSAGYQAIAKVFIAPDPATPTPVPTPTNTPTPTPTPANATPVASWRFDGAHYKSSAFQAIVGPNIPTTTAPRFIADSFGQAIALDNQSLTIADPASKVISILPKQNMTVSMWVSLDKSEQWGGLLGTIQDNGDFERGWLLGYSGNKFSFALTGNNTKRLTYLSGKTTFTPGRWYHVAATYDGATMSLFVNGALEAQTTAQNGVILYPNPMPLVLGAYRDDNENFPIEGRVYDAQLYNTTLTPAQITAQFKALAGLTNLPPVTVKSTAPF